MTDLLDRAIRTALDDLVARTPAAGPTPGGVLVEGGTEVPSRRRPALVAAAVIAVAALAATGAVALRDDPGAPAGTTATTPTGAADPDTDGDTITGATLPPANDLADVPITVPASSGLRYWRFLPDLDIAEREAAGGGTELCWRTPAGTGCIDDGFRSPDVGTIPTDGAAIFLVRPALVPIAHPSTDSFAPTMEAGPNPTTVTATFSDGSTAVAGVSYDDRFGVGYARVDVPEGLTVLRAASA